MSVHADTSSVSTTFPRKHAEIEQEITSKRSRRPLTNVTNTLHQPSASTPKNDKETISNCSNTHNKNMKCVLFKQQVSPTKIRYLLYANGKKMSTLNSTTRIKISANNTSFELHNGPSKQVQVLKAAGDHTKWINTISSAVCDCIIAESMATPLNFMKVTKCVEVLRSDFKNVENKDVFEIVELGNIMKEIVMMRAFVNKKDPGFHSGSLRRHPGVLELMDKCEKLARLRDFDEWKKLKDYVLGVYEDDEEDAEDTFVTCANNNNSDTNNDNRNNNNNNNNNNNYNNNVVTPDKSSFDNLLDVDDDDFSLMHDNVPSDSLFDISTQNATILSPTPNSLLSVTTTISPTPKKLKDLLQGTQDLKTKLEEMSRSMGEGEEEEEEEEEDKEAATVPNTTTTKANLVQGNQTAIFRLPRKSKIARVSFLAILGAFSLTAVLSGIFQLGKACEKRQHYNVNTDQGVNSLVSWICPHDTDETLLVLFETPEDTVFKTIIEEEMEERMREVEGEEAGGGVDEVGVGGIDGKGVLGWGKNFLRKLMIYEIKEIEGVTEDDDDNDDGEDKTRRSWFRRPKR